MPPTNSSNMKVADKLMATDRRFSLDQVLISSVSGLQQVKPAVQDVNNVLRSIFTEQSNISLIKEKGAVKDVLSTICARCITLLNEYVRDCAAIGRIKVADCRQFEWECQTLKAWSADYRVVRQNSKIALEAVDDWFPVWPLYAWSYHWCSCQAQSTLSYAFLLFHIRYVD